MLDWLKKAPTSLVVSIVVVFGVVSLAYVIGFAWLVSEGKDTTEYSRMINSAANWILLLVSGTGTVAAVSAARSASNAEDNTNGALTRNQQEIADTAVQAMVDRQSGEQR